MAIFIVEFTAFEFCKRVVDQLVVISWDEYFAASTEEILGECSLATFEVTL